MFSEEILLGPSYFLEDIPDFSELKGHLGVIQSSPIPGPVRMIDLPLIHCGLVELGLRAPFHIQVHAAVILLLGSRREKLETVRRGLAMVDRLCLLVFLLSKA